MSVENAVIHFDQYVHDHKFIEEFEKQDILKVLEKTETSLDNAIIFLNDLKLKYKSLEVFEFFQHLNILIDANASTINRFLIMLTKSLECPFFTALSSVIQILINHSSTPTPANSGPASPISQNMNILRRSISTDIYKRFGSPLALDDDNSKVTSNQNISLLRNAKKDFEKCYRILDHCASQDDNDCIQYAIEKGIVNLKGKYERNIFHEAAYKGHVKLVQSLVENGYDFSIQDKNHRNGLLWAAYGGHIHTVQYLMTLESDHHGNQALIYACASGHLKIVEFLALLKSIDVAAVDADGMTALHWSAFQGRIEVVKYLCALPKVNYNAKDNNGRTPLHLAASKGHLDVVQFLCCLPTINVCEKDIDGRTALHMAAWDGHLPVVQFLCTQSGVKANELSNAWLTPLDYAKNDQIKKFLLSQIKK